MTTAIIKPQWSPLTIGLMVLGFIIFWPLGLAMLGYILWGEKFGGSSEKAEAYWAKTRSWFSSEKAHGFAHAGSSGNAAFDAYRESQLRRLEEERRRLDEEIEAFHEYMETLRRAKDREEFDRFMSERRGARQGFTEARDTKPGSDWGQNA